MRTLFRKNRKNLVFVIGASLLGIIVLFIAMSCSVDEVADEDDPPASQGDFSLTCPTANSMGGNIGEAHSTFVGYTLVCADEFDGGVVDTNLWRYDNHSLGNNGAWGNSEAQYYTGSSGDNAYISDGALVIEAQAESSGGKSFTSARLHTHGTLSVTYGIIEARIKFPAHASGSTDVATFPAFWMLGDNFSGWGHTSFGGDTEWPSAGEIDIVESNSATYGYGRVLGTIHYNTKTESTPYADAAYHYMGGNTTVTGATSSYHVYAIKWLENSITYYLDGTEYFSIDTTDESFSEFRLPFFLILNLAVGSSETAFTGGRPADTSKYPQQMYIDYVRVYQGSSSSSSDDGTDTDTDTDTGTGTGTGNSPTSAPSTPPANGIAYINDASGQTVTASWQDWGAGTNTGTVRSTETVSGALLTKFTNLGYQGIQLGTETDYSTYTGVHVDIYSRDTTGIDFFLISTGNSVGASGAIGESKYTIVPTVDTWMSVDIPLTSFTGVINGGADNTVINQLKLDGGNNNGVGVTSAVWIGNIYFY